MSTFISWSGKGSKSHKVAVLLKTWLPRFIQRLPCFMSSQDIEAGSTWVHEILTQLEQCNIGIICLSKANLHKPWLYFEAGALAKRMDEARVCPLLIDLDAAEVEFPLAAFQLKTTAKDDLWDLLVMINHSSKEALRQDDLSEVFEARWHEFSAELDAILKQADTVESKSEKRSQSEILAEILSHVRSTSSLIASSKLSASPAISPFQGDDDCILIMDHLLASVRKKRPLIVSWIEESHEQCIREGFFELAFTSGSRLAGESLKRANNFKWIQECISEVCNLQLNIAILPE